MRLIFYVIVKQRAQSLRRKTLCSLPYAPCFTPLEIMPRCSAVPPVAGLHFRTIPAGFSAPLEFLTGFTCSSYWLGWEDSNLRIQVPKTCVLPLDDTPILEKINVKFQSPNVKSIPKFKYQKLPFLDFNIHLIFGLKFSIHLEFEL